MDYLIKVFEINSPDDDRIKMEIPEVYGMRK